jgi:sialic acid synthase SpsE
MAIGSVNVVHVRGFIAKEFIQRFTEAGATYVKFQHTRVAHLSKTDPQYAWFQKAEFSLEEFAELKETCEQAGTKFLTTVFHAADVSEVASLGLEAVKIGSGEAHEESLAAAIGSAGFKRVIVGCGLTQPWHSPFLQLRKNGQRGAVSALHHALSVSVGARVGGV